MGLNLLVWNPDFLHSLSSTVLEKKKKKNLVGMIMIYCIFEAQTGSSVWDFQGAGERHGEDGDPSVSVGTAAGAQ